MAFSFAKKAFLQAKKGHDGSKKGMVGQNRAWRRKKRARRSTMLNIPGGIARMYANAQSYMCW